jgi:hypothetical protein
MRRAPPSPPDPIARTPHPKRRPPTTHAGLQPPRFYSLIACLVCLALDGRAVFGARTPVALRRRVCRTFRSLAAPWLRHHPAPGAVGRPGLDVFTLHR